MKLAFRTALLGIMVLACSASRLRAGGGPSTPPQPPAPPAPAQAPAPPAPPVPPRTQEIVVDGDRVSVWDGEEEPELEIEAPEIADGSAMGHVLHGEGGYLGFLPIWMTPELRQHLGAPKDAGVLVGKVEADSPAARAGLAVGDIVTAVGGDRVKSTRELVRDVRRSKAGDTLQLEIVRNRAVQTLPVTVGKRPEEGLRVGDLAPMRHFHWSERGHPRALVAPMPPDFSGLDERMEELEKRLKELEKRLPSK